MARSSSFDPRIIPIVAIVAVFSIPVLALLRPILSNLIPLVYILSVFCLGTFCARHLLSFNHRLKMEEMKASADLARLDTERFNAAERLIESDDPLENKVREIKARSEKACDEDPFTGDAK